MKKSYVLWERNKQLWYSKTMFLDEPEKMQLINHPIRLMILRALSKEPQYPSKLAEQLGLKEQNVYYHIRMLSDAGAIEVVDKKEIRGTVAKRFSPRFKTFTISIEDQWKRFQELQEKETFEKILRFLRPFITENSLCGKIVVGSPDPHGPLKASARDGHYAIDVGLFLGKLMDMPTDFSVMLDVDVKSQKEEGNNLFILGGPVTNMIVSEINQRMAVKFTDSTPYGLYSELTGKKYTDEAVGLIARISNPINSSNIIFIIAGIRAIGTKSAVLALTRHTDRILEGFDPKRDYYRIVKGFDMDGDGKIDSIEILE